MVIKDLIRKEIERVIKKLYDRRVNFDVAISENFGDYASNVAMALKEGIPKDTANRIKEILIESDDLMKYVVKIDVAGPGFINFYFQEKVFIDNVKKILEEGCRYGTNDLLKNKKVMVEYTDPNPFKEFHIGHLMSNAIGESISRIIEFNGAETRRANYQGDVGAHVAKAIWGARKLEKDVDSVTLLGEAYVIGSKAYEEEYQAKTEINELNKKIYDRSDEEINKIYNEGRKISLDYFETIYKKLGTKFDYYFFESEVGDFGKKIVEKNINDQVFEKSEGAVVFKGERYGLHTRVFINSAGLPTYEAKELGLTDAKFNKYDPDLSISVTGNEIKEYFKVLQKVMELLEKKWTERAKKIKHLPHGHLRLASGEMSSRIGKVITAESLLKDVKERILKKMKGSDLADNDETAEQIAVGAIKYSILKHSTGKDIIFDFEKSISFEGDSGPYLQYTYARAMSVLAKAQMSRPRLKADDTKVRPLYYKDETFVNEEEVSDLEKTLFHFGEAVELALSEYEPHHIAIYLIGLAQEFNSFYAKHKIIGSDEEDYRLVLVKAVATVLKNGLRLLGISAPERM